ncbi:MAG: glycoside hydrolase family 3 N-terminal domain-containing protein, partial [Acutalibacteraceae bacterium]|nr:glycoside hydrolase family 3 N-terminal domain-containing protein [Acutalibacteraceae bacterium]
GKYLSRKNGFANYAEAMNSVSSEIKDMTFQNDPNAYNQHWDNIVPQKHYIEGVDYAKQGNLKYTDLKGVPYDDPKWDELLSQLSVKEMQRLVVTGFYQTGKAPSVGKPYTLDADGPQGVSAAAARSGAVPTSYPSESFLAMTFNPVLSYQFGQIIADELHFNSVTSWYAPAMDNHRNAYSGRNYEYYSEDPMLSAIMGSQSVLGAREKGVIVFIKHFALNDQETHRGQNLHTYSNEQAIREIYLKPFEISVKEGHANAVMDACNMIGDVFTSDYEPLNDEVLRNEWSFRGQVSTDACNWGIQTDPSNYIGITDYWVHSDALLRGGTDFWLDTIYVQGNALKYPSVRTNADIYYLRRACKNILYTEANAYVIPSSKTWIELSVENAVKNVLG